ncbi:MAG: histidine phosphatase family protein [Clostridiales bacterium]|nr:histidine phosphatase family protein [Clostridiales bacterium]
MTRIILVRHCEAVGNTLGVFQGSKDCDISGHVKEQLELLALRFRNTPIDAIYASNLKRARKTAEAINRYHNLPLQIEPMLREMDGGDFEGKSWSELAELYPEEIEKWYSDPGAFCPANGEPASMVYDRMWKAVTGIVQKNKGKTVCCVSHGCAIRNFLCHALNKPLEEMREVPGLYNTAVSIVDFDDEMHSNVVLMNDVSHLPPETFQNEKGAWWKKRKPEKCAARRDS